MLRASATVMHLGRTDIVSDGSKPIRRPMKAVEYRENTVERMTEDNISAACLFTSCKSIIRLDYSNEIQNITIGYYIDFISPKANMHLQSNTLLYT